jgi:hypothetical protein
MSSPVSNAASARGSRPAAPFALALGLGLALCAPASAQNPDSLATAAPTKAASGSVVKYAPLSIGAFSEFGMLQGGRFGSGPAFRDEWVDNFGAFITQSVSIDDRWFINVGLGGIFQFQKPEEINAEWGGTQTRNFFSGPTVADVEYELLPGSDRSWRVGLGLFPYKYNRDAANLGEYLFRTGPYPTYILTGGYSFVNSASIPLQGLKSRYQAGDVSLDVMLVTETTMPPQYDLSLAGVLRYKAFDGLLDLGAGVNFKRLVPIRPSRTSVRDPYHNNAYFKGPDGEYYTGNLAYYRNERDFYLQDTVRYAQEYQRSRATFDSVSAWTAAGGTFTPDYDYYTQAGVVVTATAAVDLKKVIPLPVALKPDDLRVFAEVGLLGVKNYPVFYEKRTERMPIMAGINLPAFGVLDLLAVQYEYFPSPHPDSYVESIQTNGAVPAFAQSNDFLLSENMYGDGLSRDDHSWSILARKTVTRGLTFSAQIARDHARMVSHAFYAGPGLAPNAIFYASDRENWYWMAQLSFGI